MKRHLLLLILICLALFPGCGCDDDDSSEDDTTADDDDNDDASDDDDDDASDDDDDDNDTDDEDDDATQPTAMRPVDLDGEPGDEVLIYEIYSEDDVNYAVFRIYSTDATLVYEHDPVPLGSNGTAQYFISEYDGEPPAEIVATYQVIYVTDDKGVSYSGQAEVLRGPTFSPVYTMGTVTDGYLWKVPDFDVDGDGIPELALETRPVVDTEAGGLTFYDIPNLSIDLAITADPGYSVEVQGMPVSPTHMAPAPFEGLSGEHFLVAFRNLFDVNDVTIYRRNASDPDGPGIQVEYSDLSHSSAYSMDLVDHDGDGDYNPFFLFNEITGARYDYAGIYSGLQTGCVSFTPRFAGDLDGDGIADLVLTDDSCSDEKGDYARAVYHFSTNGNTPVVVETTGKGTLYPFWHNPGNAPGGIAPLMESGLQYGVMMRDELGAAYLDIGLYGSGDAENRLWWSGELAPPGTPMAAYASIADFTGDGVPDIAAYATAYQPYKVQHIYNSEIYLFQGGALNDISVYHFPGENWGVITYWDYDKDGVSDLLMRRYQSLSVNAPRLLLVAPSRNFKILFQQDYLDIISVGLVGRYF